MMIQTRIRATPPAAEMRRAIARRDASYDGLFFTAVRTTGIFCRPSCTSRPPRPENVEFFPTTQQAMLAGYRPCRRCRPMESDGRPPAWVRRLIERVEARPDGRMRSSDLRAMGIEPARAMRYFKQHYGMTFQAYQRSRRLGMAFAEVRSGGGVVETAIRHGYDSSSGFSEAFEKTFGRTPGRARSSDCMTVSWITSPLGPLLTAATDSGVCLLEFADRRAIEKQIQTAGKRMDLPFVPGRHPHLDRLHDELAEYFDGRRKAFKTPLVIRGTPFQELVWRGLLKIPYGETWSYDRLARGVGRPLARRAVGRANGDNRIAIVIPCHRVIGADGRLTGYGGGLWRKQHLLDLERLLLAQA